MWPSMTQFSMLILMTYNHIPLQAIKSIHPISIPFILWVWEGGVLLIGSKSTFSKTHSFKISIDGCLVQVKPWCNSGHSPLCLQPSHRLELYHCLNLFMWGAAASPGRSASSQLFTFQKKTSEHSFSGFSLWCFVHWDSSDARNKRV